MPHPNRSSPPTESWCWSTIPTRSTTTGGSSGRLPRRTTPSSTKSLPTSRLRPPARPPQTSSRAKWGAGPTDKAPEEDWSRYTQEFEQDESWWKEYERKFWNEYDRHVHGHEAGGESEKAREPKEQPDLHVEVDQSLCIGCCSCETIAPDVFELNRNAKSNPKSKVKNPRGRA